MLPECAFCGMSLYLWWAIVGEFWPEIMQRPCCILFSWAWFFQCPVDARGFVDTWTKNRAPSSKQVLRPSDSFSLVVWRWLSAWLEAGEAGVARIWSAPCEVQLQGVWLHSCFVTTYEWIFAIVVAEGNNDSQNQTDQYRWWPQGEVSCVRLRRDCWGNQEVRVAILPFLPGLWGLDGDTQEHLLCGAHLQAW